MADWTEFQWKHAAVQTAASQHENLEQDAQHVATKWRVGVVESCFARRVPPRNASPDRRPFQRERLLGGRPGERAKGRFRNLTIMR